MIKEPLYARIKNPLVADENRVVRQRSTVLRIARGMPAKIAQELKAG